MKKIRSQYDEHFSSSYNTVVTSDTKTQQHLKEVCDVNYIMNRWLKTGVLDHVKQHAPVYGDLENFDLQESLNKVIKAEEAFMALPSKIRKLCGNDPQNFVDWMLSDRDMDLKKEYQLVKSSVANQTQSDTGSSDSSAQPSATQQDSAQVPT